MPATVVEQALEYWPTETTCMGALYYHTIEFKEMSYIQSTQTISNFLNWFKLHKINKKTDDKFFFVVLL